MIYAVNRASSYRTPDKLARASRIGELALQFSHGWDESRDRKKGYFETDWGAPQSWDDVILQGPHLLRRNPALQDRQIRLCCSKPDWSATDFEALARRTPCQSPPIKPIGDRYALRLRLHRLGRRRRSEPRPRLITESHGVQWQQIPASAP